MSDAPRPQIKLSPALLAEVVGEVTRNLKAKPRGSSPWTGATQGPTVPRLSRRVTPLPQTALRRVAQGD
jgi:hypothetical protein